MRTLLRILISLFIVLWVGAVMFFFVVAAVAFHVLTDSHAAGLVVRNCLLSLHKEGLVAGTLLLFLLLAAARVHAYSRTLLGPILCTVAMLLLTAFSQGNIMPRMEADRIAVGGDISLAPAGNSHRIEFQRLHKASEVLEGGVLGAGIAMVALYARPAKQNSLIA